MIALAGSHGAVGWKVNGAGGDGGSVTIVSASRDTKAVFDRRVAELDARYRVLPIRVSPVGFPRGRRPLALRRHGLGSARARLRARGSADDRRRRIAGVLRRARRRCLPDRRDRRRHHRGAEAARCRRHRDPRRRRHRVFRPRPRARARRTRSRTVLHVDGVAGWNDLCTDAAGRVYAGALRFAVFDPKAEVVPGELWRVAPDGEPEIVFGDVVHANGVACTRRRPHDLHERHAPAADHRVRRRARRRAARSTCRRSAIPTAWRSTRTARFGSRS